MNYKMYFLFLTILVYSCNADDPTNDSVTNLEKEVAVVAEDVAEADQNVREVFKVVEQMPRFGGCDTKECSNEALISYIRKNIEYPESARAEGIQGRAIVQFVVEKDGTVTGINVARTPAESLGLSAKKIVESMNDLKVKWQPGKQRGKDVAVMMTLPITFKI